MQAGTWIETWDGADGLHARVRNRTDWLLPSELLIEILGGLDLNRIGQIDLRAGANSHFAIVRLRDGTSLAELEFVDKTSAVGFCQALAGSFPT